MDSQQIFMKILLSFGIKKKPFPAAIHRVKVDQPVKSHETLEIGAAI